VHATTTPDVPHTCSTSRSINHYHPSHPSASPLHNRGMAVPPSRCASQHRRDWWCIPPRRGQGTQLAVKSVSIAIISRRREKAMLVCIDCRLGVAVHTHYFPWKPGQLTHADVGTVVPEVEPASLQRAELHSSPPLLACLLLVACCLLLGASSHSTAMLFDSLA
jgi:hypothetical protein